MYTRWYASIMSEKMERPFVHILFGARQTGKSTLIKSLLPADALVIDLSDPGERMRHLSNPDEFKSICLAIPRSNKSKTVFVDEVQFVPSIFDAVQHLYDNDRHRWKFILCGSSARKLRKAGTNLLPGRSFLHHLFPLVLPEQPASSPSEKIFPLSLDWPEKIRLKPFHEWPIENRLAYGSLPGVVTAEERDRPNILESYSAIHLEEEIRRESLVKDWGGFLRFLRLAAIESGNILNYTAISNVTGISIPTVKSHYQLLEDMFIGFFVSAFSKSQRKNLLSTPKFLLFDTGVRNSAAGLLPSPQTIMANPGPVFEQWVGIELWKRLGYIGNGRLFYMRTKDGFEIDFIVELADGSLVPVEVKWTETPTAGDARHLVRFIDENKKACRKGFIVCRCRRPMQIADKVTAISWKDL
ncbi:MAG TPA: hypothetical protein DCZ94_07530 [Lentisphaeria bacterium]|nr:MAG: hypothetical protein A2X48_14205 [Lentisphaerae bacterium GWF2_49_21]HBC86787.1 hypothetical protein [Lentisphaeria bacterium]